MCLLHALWYGIHLRLTELETVCRGEDVSLVDEASAALVVTIGVAEQRREGELLQLGFRVQIGRHREHRRGQLAENVHPNTFSNICRI